MTAVIILTILLWALALVVLIALRVPSVQALPLSLSLAFLMVGASLSNPAMFVSGLVIAGLGFFSPKKAVRE